MQIQEARQEHQPQTRCQQLHPVKQKTQFSQAKLSYQKTKAPKQLRTKAGEQTETCCPLLEVALEEPESASGPL